VISKHVLDLILLRLWNFLFAVKLCVAGQFFQYASMKPLN